MKLALCAIVIAAACISVTQATFCKAPSTPKNGRRSGGSYRYFRPGSKISFECNRGYRLEGSKWTQCIYDRSRRSVRWTKPTPRCVLFRSGDRGSRDDDDDDSSSSSSRRGSVYCPTLSRPDNGWVKYISRRPGSYAKYTCNSGYVLSGNTYRRCQSSGQWTGTKPSCTRAGECPVLKAPSNGRVKHPSPRSVGSRVWYSCNSGFNLVGSESRRCQSNLRWDGEAPTCKARGCGRPRSPDNGWVKFSSTSVGAKVWHFCKNGFALVGSESRTCKSNGQWEPALPTCKRIVTCDKLSDPSKGDVDQNGNRPGATATYSCDHGYQLVGGAKRTCQNNGKWSGKAPTCKLITCDKLSDPANGDVDQNGNRPRAIATYSCDRGYQLVGAAKRTCQNNGKWSGKAPTCRLITCDTLSKPANGNVDQQGSTPGSTATYTCDSGFELVGQATRTCQDNGKWSGQDPRCRLVDCGNLRNPINGRVDLSGTVFGSIATYTCNSGFSLVGRKTRTCQDSGQWSGEAPTCQRDIVDCGVLKDPENGAVDSSDGTTEGSIATYSCFDGFEIKGVTSRTCTRDGWSETEPTCEPVDCGSLSDPSNGRVIFRDTFFNSVATYECFFGYEISGQATRTCQSDGTWSGVAPKCEPVDCGPLDDPVNGRVVVPATVLLSIASYSCDPGYVLVGVPLRRCQPGGTWSNEAPSCQPLLCPPLPPPPNGDVDVPSRTVNSVATYTCNQGFNLQGDETRNCQIDGSWSGTIPSCVEVVECEQLESPANGAVVVSGVTVGSTANYSCTNGYTLDGDEERVCQQDEEWTGVAPTCRLVDCGSLPAPDNGGISFPTGTTFGSDARYTCNPGFILQGTSRRVCTAAGSWSGSEPVCLPIDCGPLSSPANGKVELTETTVMSTAEYSCDQGFALVGNFIRVCLINGQWSGDEPVCRSVIAMCPTLSSPENGNVEVSGLSPGDVATYTCFEGYLLQGVSQRSCQDNGDWTESAPTCQPVDCGPLPDPQNGRVEVFDTTLGAPAMYRCDQGFDLVGERQRFCIVTGEWSDEAPTCQAIECPNLSSPSNGSVSLNGITVGSLATYECDTGFELSGNERRSCLATGQWSGNDPECIIPARGCGDPGVPDNGRRFGDEFSTGSVVFFRCFDNFDLVGSKYRVCQENGEWSDTQPTCTPFNDECTGNNDIYDRCRRRCQCVNGRLVNCCRVRRDYVALTREDRFAYINTILRVSKDPIYKPRFDALITLFKDSFTANTITQSGTPSTSQYFVFARYFMLEYEDILRDFNCSLTIPYYDWTPFPVAPYTAAVWANTDGFGDTSRVEDNCVITGPVRVGQYEIAPSAGGGCLKREYKNMRFPSRDIVDRDLLPLPVEEFDEFHRFLQLLLGLNVQCFVGGTMCGVNAANDPVFLLHLAQLDSLLMRWQFLGQGRNEVRYAFDNSALLLSPGFRVSDFSNNLNLPYDICVIYDPPVLLKNHSPGVTTLAHFRAPLAAPRPPALTMDCAPATSMQYMDNLMDTSAHSFMEEKCETMKP